MSKYNEWTVSLDIGCIYVQHSASLDMLVLDATDLSVIENDLNGRIVPVVIQQRAKTLAATSQGATS